ncbi:MAG: S28 family serine protease [Bacteroidota bacterium]
MRWMILSWVAFVGQIAAQAQTTALEQALFGLPDVIFKAIDAPDGYAAAYELHIKQPIDHNNPDKGHFYQRAFLSHRGFNRPTVICTEGYTRSRNRVYELTNLIAGNQIDVEHRYFGSSMPAEKDLDYQYLNLEQATADLHHINQLFRQIYSGKWLSTGISKGGQTTIFYRYFYPEDVDVSVPYVAPLNLALEEERIYTFLDTVGTDACRDAIYDVQEIILQNREEVLPKLQWYAKGAGLEFDYLGFEEAFEYSVLEYPFAFWQLGGRCEEIPPKSAGVDVALDHLLAASGMDLFSDASMEAYASHYYQAGAEMGYYSYETEDFEGLLKALPMEPNPSAIFMPGKMPKSFDGKLVNAVAEWLPANGDRFIYINGDSDTWSATAVRPTDGIDAVWFFMPGKDHGRARIRNMSSSDRAKLVDALERWLEMEIE